MRKFILIIFLLTVGLSAAMAQRVITGVITSSDGNPLIGANVVETGTANGVSTDIDGTYSITVGDNAVLEFSYTGFETQSLTVGTSDVINIVLLEGVALGEIVVTALGIEREKKALGYSVTEVGGEDFTEAREINIANSLSGKIAGVNVSNIASGPAGSSRVIIRGNNSLTGNNQPLYVVDGIPIDNTNLGAAGMWGGSDGGDGVSSVNPDDIETISVLKGNSAAALYGSRASNGVILITTKGGSQREGIGVDLSSNFTFENIINTYDFQDEYGSGNRGARPSSQQEARDFGLSAWGERLDGSSVVQFDGVSRPYSAVGDNLAAYYRTGGTWTNSISLYGGQEEYDFRLGITNLQNDGIVPNSGVDRNTFTTKVRARFFDRLSASMSGSYSVEDVQNRPRLSDAPGNANYIVANLPPNVSVEDMAGPNGNGTNEDGVELETDGSIFVTNPYFAARRFETSDKRNRLIGNFTLRFDFTDWLYIQGRIGIDQYTSRRRNLTPYGTGYSPMGQLSEQDRRFTEVNKDFLLGVDKKFGAIGLNAFVGGNQMDNMRENLGGSGSQFSIPFLETLSNLANQSPIYSISEKAINSVYGSIELSYNDILYLTGTARQDWFSTLSNIAVDDEDNAILYPSVSASFIFSDAFEMPSWLTFGKIRGSWAQVGGDTDPYNLALTYGLVGQGHLGNPLGRIAQGRIPNANLVPLSNTEVEIGVDLRLLKNRLGIDFAYYDRKTEDDILFASVSQTSGYGSQVVNVGEVTNNGIELLITGTPVRTNDLTWEVTFNLAKNNSNVSSLLDPENDDLAGTDQAENLRVAEARSRNAYIHHIEGFPYSAIMGFRYARDASGNIQLDDNGLPMQGDFGVLGVGVHDLTGGINNTIRYKELSLSFLLDFKSGGDIYSGTNRTAYGAGLHMKTLEGRESGTVTLADGQTTTLAPNDVQDYWSRVASITEEFVYDASFLKLRQLTLSYSLPRSIIGNTPFTRASVAFVGRNLWLISSNVDNIDPEATYNNANGQGLEWYGVPQTRTFGFDLNLSF